LQNKRKSSAKKIQKALPVGGVESTGHADSPATIVIGHKKRRSRPASSDFIALQVYCFIAISVVFLFPVQCCVTVDWLSGRANSEQKCHSISSLQNYYYIHLTAFFPGQMMLMQPWRPESELDGINSGS